jgi:glucosamine-6-phosphate deaminase
MVVGVYASKGAAASAAARLVVAALHRKASLVLGLPTGRTSVPFYRDLVRLHRRGEARFARATSFNLDEFRGLEPGDPRSFGAFMQRSFFRHVDLPKTRAHFPDANARDWRRAAAAYDKAIRRAGGLDMCVVGIGRNGHVAFNEPSTRLSRRTHLQRLSRRTRRDTAAAFGGRWQSVPPRALTIGVGAILDARQVVLLATGASKGAIIRRALQGRITPRVPASILRRHPHLTVILDRAAAARLGW